LISSLPTQNLVFLDDPLAEMKREVRPFEMLAGLTGHKETVDFTKGMIQFLPTRFIPSLYGITTGWDCTERRWDPFHRVSDG